MWQVGGPRSDLEGEGGGGGFHDFLGFGEGEIVEAGEEFGDDGVPGGGAADGTVGGETPVHDGDGEEAGVVDGEAGKGGGENGERGFKGLDAAAELGEAGEVGEVAAGGGVGGEEGVGGGEAIGAGVELDEGEFDGLAGRAGEVGGGEVGGGFVEAFAVHEELDVGDVGGGRAGGSGFIAEAGAVTSEGGGGGGVTGGEELAGDGSDVVADLVDIEEGVVGALDAAGGDVEAEEGGAVDADLALDHGVEDGGEEFRGGVVVEEGGDLLAGFTEVNEAFGAEAEEGGEFLDGGVLEEFVNEVVLAEVGGNAEDGAEFEGLFFCEDGEDEGFAPALLAGEDFEDGSQGGLAGGGVAGEVEVEEEDGAVDGVEGGEGFSLKAGRTRSRK